MAASAWAETLHRANNASSTTFLPAVTIEPPVMSVIPQEPQMIRDLELPIGGSRECTILAEVPAGPLPEKFAGCRRLYYAPRQEKVKLTAEQMPYRHSFRVIVSIRR